MIIISYATAVTAISIIWCAVRATCALRRRAFDWRRELQLLLVYACIVVVARYVFFPFSRVNGTIQPLIFDVGRVFPPRTNLIPLVNLFNYPSRGDIVKNVLGNVLMFVPLGIVWPVCFERLRTPVKAIATGASISLLIELLQLPFYGRVSDVDDLLLNSLGFAIGYGIYLLWRAVARRREKRCKNDL